MPPGCRIKGQREHRFMRSVPVEPRPLRGGRVGRWRQAALAVALAAVGLPVAAQQLPFTNLTSGAGPVPLPSASVQAVTQDHLGFVWLGFFSAGLARYDGHRLELYGLEDGLVDSTVRAVVEDRQGYLWVGAETGLVVSEWTLDAYRSGEKVHFTDRVDGQVLVRARIRHGFMVPDPHGGVWVATVGENVVHYRITPAGGLELRRVVLGGVGGQTRRPLALTATADGSLWVADQNGGLVVLPAGGAAPVPPRLLLPEAPVSALEEGRAGRVWAGCRDGSVWLYEPGAVGFKLVSRALDEQVSSILETSAGEVWVTTLGAGVLVLERGGAGGERRLTGREGLPSDTAWQVLEDREHDLWIAHNAGISRLRYDYRAFAAFTGAAGPGAAAPLPESTTFAVVAPSPSRGDAWLWVATGGGLVALAPDGRAAVLGGGPGRLPSASVYALTRDPEGRLWVGTLHGLVVLAPTRAGLPAAPRSVATVRLMGRALWLGRYGLDTIYDVRALALLTAGGAPVVSVWVSGVQGVTCYADGRWIHLGVDAGLPLAGAAVTALDGSGRLWVGTRTSGVYRSRAPLDLGDLAAAAGPDGAVRRRLLEPFWDRALGAPTDSVFSLLWAAGRMWVGSDAGLDAFAAGDRPELHLDRGSGLGGDRVVAMAAGGGNAVWVAQDGGLADIDATTGTVERVVTRADGLVDDEAWGSGCVAVGEDGAVLLGTPKGVSRYRPALDTDNPVAPLLALRGIALSGGVGGHNQVVIRYAALSFADERAVRYRTRLEGYDQHWSEPTREVVLRYTNLPAAVVPRTYTFAVTACNDAGVWAPEPLRYRFTIAPPWWATWWAVLLWAGLLALAGSSLVVLRTLALSRRTRHLEAQVDARTSEIFRYAQQLDLKSREAAQANAAKSAFLATMSHELRTPMNSIVGFSEILRSKLAGRLEPPLDHFLDNIHSSAVHLLSLINDILDLSKVEAGRMELELERCDVAEVVDGVLRVVSGMSEARGIQLEQEIAADIPPLVADVPRVKQILYNLLSNAVKFSHDGGRVTVRGRFVPAGLSPLGLDTVSLAVEDRGIGIAPEDHAAVFDDFRQLDAGDTSRPPGTGLGLALVKRFTELHGGRVELASEPGRGTTFTVLLPLSAAEARSRTSGGAESRGAEAR